MGDVKNGYQATPNATLEQQMMDACAPKNEREWWAFTEIGRLRAEVEALKAKLAEYSRANDRIVAELRECDREVEALRADSNRLDFLDTNLSRNFGWQVAIAPAGKLSVQSVAYPASPPVPIRFAIDTARAAQGGGHG